MNSPRVLWLCLAVVITARCLGQSGEPAKAGATPAAPPNGAGSSRAVLQPALANGETLDGGLKQRPAAAEAAPTPAEPLRFSAGPAVNWTFPVFTDREGFRQLLLRGTEARAINTNHIEVTGFHAVVFSGDASERVDTVLLSPQATFRPRENRASGASTVRLILSGRGETIRDDVELTGRGWTYDHGAKKVSIAHDVRVTFHAQLNDILQ